MHWKLVQLFVFYHTYCPSLRLCDSARRRQLTALEQCSHRCSTPRQKKAAAPPPVSIKLSCEIESITVLSVAMSS